MINQIAGITVLGIAATTLSAVASPSAFASLVTIEFDGITSQRGGTVFGDFIYDTASLSNGFYSLNFFEITENGGLNIGGPFTVPQTPIGVDVPAGVTSVPQTDGLALVGTLNMSYTDGGVFVNFDVTFSKDATVSGTLEVTTVGTDILSGPVTYTLVSPVSTPEPGTAALLALGLLGLGVARSRRPTSD